MKSSLGPPTRYEQARIDAMVRLGCVACAVLGIPYARVEVHHIKDGNKKMGHWFTIGVCAGHHRGEFSDLQKELIPREKRVSIHGSGSKEFNKYYLTQRQLWERVQDRLGLPAVWPTSKILPRREYVRMDKVAVEVSTRSAVVEVLPDGSAARDPAAGDGS